MSAYFAVFSARFRTLLQYRAAAWAGVGTQVFWGLIRIMTFAAFFASSAKTQPMNFAQVVNYIWLGQALLLLIPFREDTEISQMIRSGNIAYELVRPVRLYWFWFARQIANRVAPVLLRASPMIIVAAFVFPLVGMDNWALHPPVSAGAFGLFLASITAATLLGATLGMIMTISMFWTMSADGFVNVAFVIIWPLCGIVLPLSFFPDWMQPVLHLLPFRGLMDVPFQVYIGTIPAHAALREIGVQCLWIFGLILASHALLKRGLKRVVVQGG